MNINIKYSNNLEVNKLNIMKIASILINQFL
jgi:hypothetical protein